MSTTQPTKPVNENFWALVSKLHDPDVTVFAANLPGGCLILTLTDHCRNADPVYAPGNFYLGGGKFVDLVGKAGHKVAEKFQTELQELRRTQHEAVKPAPFVPMDKVSSQLPVVDDRDIQPPKPVEAEPVSKGGKMEAADRRYLRKKGTIEEEAAAEYIASLRKAP